MKNQKGNIELAKIILQSIEKAVLKPFKGTMTLTFGEVAESHVGMQKIGQTDKVGFSLEDLLKAQSYFESQGCETSLLNLNNFLPQNCEDEEEINSYK